MALIDRDLENIRAKLLEAVERSRPDGLPGATAGQLVRTVVPTFRAVDLGFANLRAFLAQHVPELCVIGRAGADLRYGLSTWASEASPTKEPTLEHGNDDLWRIWVSPGNVYKIVAHRDGEHARAASNNDPMAAAEVSIGPAPAELHRQIAKRYLEERTDLNDDFRHLLTGAVNNENAEWWARWASLFRSAGPEEQSRWLDFRRRHLEEELTRALKATGLGDDAIKKIHAEIVHTKARAPRSNRDAKPQPGQLAAMTSEIAQVVIGRMSMEEIRALRLPLGLVMDAIAERHSSR
jgi:hypothetical protein